MMLKATGVQTAKNGFGTEPISGGLRRKHSGFSPTGVSGKGYYLYAVVVADHPALTKIGRSFRWATRYREYETWNLRVSGGCIDWHAYQITEEFVDLPAIEAELIERLSAYPVRRREWFDCDIETASREIDKLITGAEMSYLFSAMDI